MVCKGVSVQKYRLAPRMFIRGRGISYKQQASTIGEVLQYFPIGTPVLP